MHSESLRNLLPKYFQGLTVNARPQRALARLALRAIALLAPFTLPSLHAQSSQPQTLVFAGLRSVSAHGVFRSIRADHTGSLYLLFDQGDGVRLLKTDAAAASILADVKIGAAGDIGLALAVDSSGNVFVAGTSTSTTLPATPGAAFAASPGTGLNSFIARFDSALHPIFVTFTGGSDLAVSALAITPDAVFVAGTVFSTTLPVTSSAFQKTPAPGTSENGFVERFSLDGTSLLYATYLTGSGGYTAPAAIAADTADNVYVVGSTSSPAFPTANAFAPVNAGTASGFFLKLAPLGDSVVFSTFIPGLGLTSISLNSAAQSLFLSGSIDAGSFPVETVRSPIAQLNYQSLLELTLDGSTLIHSTLLAPGSQSILAPGSSGDVWVGQSLSTPLLPIPALTSIGNAMVLHRTAQGTIDQAIRLGGLPNGNLTFASLPLSLNSLLLSPAGSLLAVGSVQPTASSSLLATETYDLPLSSSPTAVLPSSLSDAESSSSLCTGSLCSGSAGYLAQWSPTASGPSLFFSSDDAPLLTLRNLASTGASALQLSAGEASISSNCPMTLPSGAECAMLLSGNGPAAVTASAADTIPVDLSLPSFPAPAATLAFSPKELDFGIQTSGGPAALQTLTISNLDSVTQTFTSASSTSPPAGNPGFTEISSDCLTEGDITLKSLAAGATCHISLGFTAASTPASDGPIQQLWRIGSREVLLTAYSQAAPLSLSSSTIDFGTRYPDSPAFPRFLHLSNASSSTITHAPLTLPLTSSFAITDNCPSILAAQSICTIRFDYRPPTSPSNDSVTLFLDQGLSVLLAGENLPQAGPGSSLINPNLSFTPASVTFPNPIAVTATSGPVETVAITNSGAAPFAVSLAVSGDYSQQTSCPETLPGGQTCAITLTFVPSQPGTRPGLLTVKAGTGYAPIYIPLSGTGVAILPAGENVFDLGPSIVGQPVTQFYKITQPFTTLNASTSSPFTVALIPDLGFGPGQPKASAFASSATQTCPECYLGIRFNPSTSGPQTGVLSLSSGSTGTPYTLTLTGQGLPNSGLLLTPAAPDFGSIPVHSSGAPILFTLTNLVSTAQPITVNAPALTGDFTFSTLATGGQPCDGLLAYEASCFIALDFAPQTSGSRSGTLAVRTTSGDVTAPLTGFGTPDPGLAFTPNTLVFNAVPGSAAISQTITLTNTGSLPLQISSPILATSAFAASTTCSALAPNATCTITVTFTPSAAIASDTLTLTAVSGITATYAVPLTGTYTTASAGVEILPAQVDYGPAAIGGEGTGRQFSVLNLTNSPLTLNAILPRQFALVTPPCLHLDPSASCTFNVDFVPVTAAAITGSIQLLASTTAAASSFGTIAYLSGFGTAQAGPLTLSGPLQSGMMNFGQVISGQTKTITLVLSNQNSANSPAITIHRILTTPPFLSGSTCVLPLQSGQSCYVNVTYTPANQVAAGTPSPASTSDTGLLTLESDASSSPDLLHLTGQAGAVPAAVPSDLSPFSSYTLSQNSLTFSSIKVGQVSPAQVITLSNTGSLPLHLTSAAISGEFTSSSDCATVPVSAACSIRVTDSPVALGTHTAALQLVSDSAVSLEFVTLLSTSLPATLSLTPATLNFGSVLLLSSSLQTVQITNTGADPITINNIQVSGDYQTAGDCPSADAALAAGQSCTVKVSFTPLATGIRAGTLSITNSASTLPLTVSLTGIGVQPHLTFTPAKLNFGSITLGSSSSLSLTFTNSGTAALTGIAFTLSEDFALASPCPVTLAPAASCTTGVIFTPTVVGTRNGTLTLASSDSASPAAIPLAGVGTAVLAAPGSFTLTVDGTSTSTLTLTAPESAAFNLTLTPTGGFTGSVILACVAIQSGPYASCSLQPSTLTLSGTPQAITATISTLGVIHLAQSRELRGPVLLCLLLPASFLLRRSRLLSRSLLLLLSAVTVSSCGRGSNPNIRYSPPGTYQYKVSASSTSGPPVTQTVTLNIVVQ